MRNGQHIVALQGQVAVGLLKGQVGAVGDIFARGEVAEHFEIIQVHAADDGDGQLVKLAGQLQGLAQLFLGLTIGQCGNVVEGAQGLQLALGFALSLLALSVAL